MRKCVSLCVGIAYHFCTLDGRRVSEVETKAHTPCGRTPFCQAAKQLNRQPSTAMSPEKQNVCAKKSKSLCSSIPPHTSPSGSNARQRITHRLAQRSCPRRAQAIEAVQKRENFTRVRDTHTSTPSRTITSRPATQETKKARIRHGSPCTTWHINAQSAQASLLKLEFPPASRATQLGFDSLLANPRQMMIVNDDNKGCALRTRSWFTLQRSLHQTWRRVRLRFMLELPTVTLWSTVFEQSFIKHIRHAPTHTPQSRTRGIVIARVCEIQTRGSHDTLFRKQVPVVFFRTQGLPPRSTKIICQAEDAAGRVATRLPG